MREIKPGDLEKLEARGIRTRQVGTPVVTTRQGPSYVNGTYIPRKQDGSAPDFYMWGDSMGVLGENHQDIWFYPVIFYEQVPVQPDERLKQTVKIFREVLSTYRNRLNDTRTITLGSRAMEIDIGARLEILEGLVGNLELFQTRFYNLFPELKPQTEAGDNGR